jgi:CubicO group peptidase (beta-lactamase class C family)
MTTRPPIVCSVVRGKLRGDQPDLIVPWWSITKTALAACALVLVAGGRLDLDRPMSGRNYTLRQVLQHTSGLTCYTEHPDYDPAVDAHQDPWPDARILEQAETIPLRFSPGQGWSYSNTGYFLVRRLIEQATGLDIERALKELVLGPLGAGNVFIARTRADLGRSVFGDEDDFHPGWVRHGLLMGPPSGPALFMHGLFTGALLPPPLFDAMRVRFAVAADLKDRPWRTAGYGLGLMMDIASPHGLCIGHSGQGPDSVAAAYHFPDLDPPVTIAAFSPTDDQGIAERAVLDEAEKFKTPGAETSIPRSR